LVRPFTAISVFAVSSIPGSSMARSMAWRRQTRGASTIWRAIQTGNVQHYAAMFLVGALALLAYYLGQL
jgi:hypothetical protein